MIKNEAQLEKLVSELRRGTLVLSVLSQLHSEQYGYSLMQVLTVKGMDIEQGTLYPLLRRLEKQGLLESEWRVEEGRPRRYYKISADGEAIESALRVPFIVFDQGGNEVSNGQVGDEPLALERGVYNILVRTQPPERFDEVVIQGGDQVILRLK